MIITETNVPHQENISYLGKSNDEAQMVYNFTLPPLLLHTFIESDTAKLSKWAKNLQIFSEKNTFFNFTASHDGIGVRPLEGIVSSKELDNIINVVKENGGYVSYKDNSDGSKSPYELNITYVDALLDKKNKESHVDRFIASQAVALSLPGMPAIYIHSLLGSRNWQEGVEETKRARSINRKKLVASEIEKELSDENSFRSRIFHPYIKLLEIRRKQPAFHPNAFFEILELDPKLFCIKRYCPNQIIFSITNFSNEDVTAVLRMNVPTFMLDLKTGDQIVTNGVKLKPYKYIWFCDTIF
jgi:sucrose phosphorylase